MQITKINLQWNKVVEGLNFIFNGLNFFFLDEWTQIFS